jgi:O-antigen ligase
VVLVTAILVAAPWYYGAYPDFARYGVAALVLFAAGLWLWARPPVESRLVVPVLCLGAWAFVQAARGIGGSPIATLESGLVLAGDLAVIIVFATLACEKGMAMRLAVVVIALCGAQTAFGIVQHSLDPVRLYGSTSEYIASPYGSYHNHNHFAGLIEMGALLAAGLALGRAKKAETIDPGTLVLGGASLALAGAVVASRSRGGVLALAGGAAFLVPLWFWAERGRDRGRAMMAAGFVGLLVLGFGWAAVPAATRAHVTDLLSGPTDASGQYRVSTYEATLRLAAQHPLVGAGLGTFADAVGPLRQGQGTIRVAHADSDVLEFVAEAGVIGLGLLGWVVWGGLSGFRLCMREGRDPLRKGLAVGALAAIVALFIHSFVDFNLRVPANAILFSALAGLASASRARSTFRVFPRPRWVACVCVVLSCAALWRCAGALEYARIQGLGDPHRRLAALTSTVRMHPYLASAWRLRGLTWSELAKGDPVIARLRLESARDDAEKSISLRPLWPEAWIDLGWARLALGDKDGGRAAMDRSMALDPSRVSIGLARVEFFARIGDSDAVLQELLRIHQRNGRDWSLASAEQVALRVGLEPAKIDVLKKACCP